MLDVADPRRFPDPAAAPPHARRLHQLAQDSLTAATGAHSQALDDELAAAIGEVLAGADPGAAGARLAEALATAPSVAVHRHVWRAIVHATARPRASPVAVTLFAIPLVLVAGVAGGAQSRVELAGTLPDAPALVALLSEHGALGGNRSFSIANALVAPERLDVAALPGLLAALDGTLAGGVPLALPPSPLVLPVGESVHLRFLVGSAVGSADVDVLRDAGTGRWGRPLTAALAQQLGAPGVTLLPLPRPPAPPLAAVAQGRTVQRDVSAQLFASNAIRQVRASVGEPAAVISAHHAPDAPGGGELRLSLSSPFSPRDAYGFRCPLLPGERAVDAATMLSDLLAAARVADVHIVPGVHGDRDPVTGGPLLFKPGTMPGSPGVQ